MEHAGALYYERGVRYFEIGEYELRDFAFRCEKE